MPQGAYYIISETTEDRFYEVDSLDEALGKAKELAEGSQAGDPISIEHDGRVIRQFVLTPEGVVKEESVR
jgi:hypothetical protein